MIFSFTIKYVNPKNLEFPEFLYFYYVNSFAVDNLRHKTILMLVCSAGLRFGEVVRLKRRILLVRG